MDDSDPIGGKAAIRGRLRPETRRLILDVLKEIDPPHRDVLWMRDAEGRPLAAIASALSIPSSVVQARLRKARRKFRVAVERLRRQPIPFARDVPLDLAVLQQEGPDVPFEHSEDLLRQMALSLRVLNPVRLTAALEGQDNPPDSAVRSRPRPANPPGPGRRA